LYVLPADAVGRHGIFRWLRLVFRLAGQCRDDIVRVGGLGEVIDGAEFDRRHCGGDIAVTRQDDRARIRALLTDFFDHVQSVAVFKPHVDDRVGRGDAENLGCCILNAIGGFGRKSALFHCTRQPLLKRLVVVDDQETHVPRSVE